jgi:phosphate-selective porin OprO/OprP
MNPTLRLAISSLISLSAATAWAEDRPAPSPPAPTDVTAQLAPSPATGSPADPNAPPPGPADTTTPAPAPARDVSSADPAVLQQRVDELDQKLKVIERRWEIEQEQGAERKAEEKKNPPPGVAVAYAKDGVSIRSADGKFSFRLRPVVQADARFFFVDNATNTFLLRRVRPVIEGTVFEYFDWRMMPELAGTPNVQDAYVNIRVIKEAQIRAGKFKPPVGIERLASDSDLPLIERGLSTNLVPDRDVGIQLHGDILDSTITYAIGLFNGVGDGVNADVDNNDKKDWVGRLFFHPFRLTSVEPLQKFGIGIAGSRGTQAGALPAYRTSGQVNWFQYATSAQAAGTHRRIAPQAYFYWGPFGAFGEWVRASQIVSNGIATERVDHEAWVVAASVFVTGEDASYTTVTPKEQLDPARGGFGAIELVARYGVLKIDPTTFRQKFADPTTSASKASAWAIGLNWHLARNYKFMIDYERTNYDGGAKTGDKQSEIVVLSRLQAAY